MLKYQHGGSEFYKLSQVNGGWVVVIHETIPYN